MLAFIIYKRKNMADIDGLASESKEASKSVNEAMCLCVHAPV